VPTLVHIAGGPQGDALNQQIMAGSYPGIVKTRLDGFDQTAYLEGTSDESARDHLFYYSGANPSAVRYKNWKFYFAMAPDNAEGGFMGVQTYHWTQVTNLGRDPLENNVLNNKSALQVGGALTAPSTAYIYDWNLLPIGQMMWLRELETYRDFPPLQTPASYNLDQIIHQMQEAKTTSHMGQ
jgi:arylsulfatase